MLRKNLFAFVSLLLSGLLYAQPDTVCGWYGPVPFSSDTGHIAISDTIYSQGQHSLNFVVRFVADTIWEGAHHADFCKYFGGIELPDSLKWDICADTNISGDGVDANSYIRIIYKDTTWVAYHSTGGPPHPPNWREFTMDSVKFATGALVAPNYAYPHFPPHRIDSLKFRIESYALSDDPRKDASFFIDNLRFYYAQQETLVDGMGEKSGIEEEVLPLGQVLEIFPNPCGNSAIEISYSLQIPGYVRFEVYDIAGSKIMAFTEKGKAGKYRRLMNLKDKRLPSGVYFLHMTTDNISTTRKFILLR